MKKILLLCLISTLSYFSDAQDTKWAAGVRIGEPGGIMVRRNLNNGKNALELNIGTYGGFWGQTRKYREGNYNTVGIAIGGNYIWHQDYGKMDGVKWYYGIGGQINSRRYDFLSAGTLVQESTLSIGGNALAGAEYFLNDSPISIFAELAVYVELLQQPAFVHPQGGIGMRFNF